MADEAAIPVLRRKAGRARAAPEAPAMTPEKAMRTAVARAGDAALGVPVSMRALALGEGYPEKLAEDWPEPALFALLQGADGRRALAVACPQAVAAAVEAQTMGQVLPGEAAERRPTRIDAAMLEGFLDALLGVFGDMAEGCEGLPGVAGYRCDRPVADARAGAMALEDVPHVSAAAELDFGLGAKAGRLALVFPARAAGRERGAPDGAMWRDRMQRSVLGSEARLQAVLCRMQRPLSAVTGLAVGDVVPLGAATLDGVALSGPGGRTVIRGRLGRSGAMRAVRVRIGTVAAGPGIEGPERARPGSDKG